MQFVYILVQRYPPSGNHFSCNAGSLRVLLLQINIEQCIGQKRLEPVSSAILSTSLLSLDPWAVAWLQQGELAREDPLDQDPV